MANSDTIIKTGGGASAGRDVQASGDFVGRDQTNININIMNWAEISAEFINDLNTTIGRAQTEKEEEIRKKKRKKKPAVDPIKTIQDRIDGLNGVVTKFDHFDWSKAERAYLDKVIKLYDRMRILGHSTDVILSNIFTQVYILDKPTARQRYDIDELRRRGHERLEFQRQPGKRMHGMTLVKEQQNLFILGKPGAGKTTFLKYITIQAAYKQLPRIPIFVSLNQWAESQWGKGEKAALLPFLIEQFDICDFPDASLFIDYLLREGRALVLFDGLDEVKQEKEQRRRLTYLLQDFARKYDHSQHLITCRIAASDYAFEGFVDVEVADFIPEQVREYAHNWFGIDKKKFDAFINELAKPENKGLAELCNTPLLLALLCLTFDNGMRFPPSRAELYEDALETLLRKWDNSRQIQRDEIYRELSHKRKLQLLMRIAVPTFEEGELFFRQRDLERWIINYLTTLPGAPPADNLDGTAILKAMEAQHSILVERAQGIYSFSHLTFQEYLTARYLAENQGRGVTHKLIHNHLTDPRWRDVFLLTTSLLDDADEFIIGLRQAINGVVATAPILHYLLTWAYSRTKQAKVSVERATAIQLAYIFLASESARTSENAFYLAHAMALALTNKRESALSRSFSLVNDLIHTSDRALVLDIALASARSLARSTAPLVGFDYSLYYSWIYASIFAGKSLGTVDEEWQAVMQQFPSLIRRVVSLATEGGLANLAQQVATQPIPSPNSSQHEWQQYADRLFAILRHERDLGREWNFSYDEIDKLNNYFYANELLVQCIKVAAVTDRQALLNGLLLPPGAGQGEGVKG